MALREIESGELQTLLDLYKDLHEGEPSTSASNIANRDKAKQSWAEIQNNPRIKYFGVFIDDELLSTCTITIIPNLTRSCRPYGLIENVVTRKSHRKKGFGKALLQHTLQYAWQENCYKVMLMTGRLDEATFSFYESAGFERKSKQAFVAKPSSPQA